MKRSMFYVCLFIVTVVLIGCSAEGEAPFTVSVQGVEIDTLESFSGTTLPGSKEEALAGAMNGLNVMVPAISAIFTSPDLQGNTAARAIRAVMNTVAPESRTIDGKIDFGEQDMSGNLVITDEPILIGPEGEKINVGTVNSLNASFAIHMSATPPPAPPDPFSANGTGDLGASISFVDFNANTPGGKPFTVENAQINAAAKAKATLDIPSWTEGGTPSSLFVDYNIGAALSVGFSVSSTDAECLVGKYLITLDLSAKKAARIDLSDPSTISNAISIVVTISIYGNDNVLLNTYTYTEQDLLSLITAPSQPPAPEPVP